MYRYIDNRTIYYNVSSWPEHIKDLRTPCIQYLEIGSLHGGSLIMFHSMFGPNVQSTSIDPFSKCDNYNEYDLEHERNYEIYKILGGYARYATRKYEDVVCVNGSPRP